MAGSSGSRLSLRPLILPCAIIIIYSMHTMRIQRLQVKIVLDRNVWLLLYSKIQLSIQRDTTDATVVVLLPMSLIFLDYILRDCIKFTVLPVLQCFLVDNAFDF